jgi:ArsR family transcriptional regulator, arsenate/arsenite/antimonite-responsive transcriptional repressor / arsenate reductase (thioredoxin)
MERAQRAEVHRALSDEARLQIIDELALSDRTPQELARIIGSETNLLAHHLGVLTEAGLVRRRVSSGDRRRRYISLETGMVRGLLPELRLPASSVVFVCTHNSARSQFAEALLRSRSKIRVQSAGPNPRSSLHPKAIQVGTELGVDLSGLRPKGYGDVEGSPDLVISVCDLALEARIPFQARRLHWSIPDPVETGRVEDFRRSFIEIDRRVGLLVDAIEREEQP